MRAYDFLTLVCSRKRKNALKWCVGLNEPVIMVVVLALFKTSRLFITQHQSWNGPLLLMAVSSKNEAQRIKPASRAQHTKALRWSGETYLAGNQLVQGGLGGHGGAGVAGCGGGGDRGGGRVMALLDEIGQEVNTACKAISLLMNEDMSGTQYWAGTRTRTRTGPGTRTRPGTQSFFLCYTLESKTGTVETSQQGKKRSECVLSFLSTKPIFR